MNRISTHATQKDFDQISYARVDGDRETLNEIESALIITERPPWNHSYEGNLTHPTGHGWTREEALAILDKYRREKRQEQTPPRTFGGRHEWSSQDQIPQR